ncbi:MAG: hypothetical protein AB7I27_16570 [Bacteriovoracaceae bacterium]
MEFNEQLKGFLYSWFWEIKQYGSIKDPKINVKYSVLALFILTAHMTMASNIKEMLSGRDVIETKVEKNVTCYEQVHVKLIDDEVSLYFNNDKIPAFQSKLNETKTALIRDFKALSVDDGKYKVTLKDNILNFEYQGSRFIVAGPAMKIKKGFTLKFAHNQIIGMNNEFISSASGPRKATSACEYRNYL